MDVERKPESKGPKKAYSRPELKKVTLAPDEAVLGNCKVNNSTSNSNIPASICNICGGSLGS